MRDPPRALREIPTLAMLTATAASLQSRAARAASRLRDAGLSCDVIETEASVGGGAFPTARIASRAIAFAGNADELERRARLGATPVIGRIANGRFLVDVRSVPEALDDQLVRAFAGSPT